MADDTLQLDDFLPYRLSVATNLVTDVIAKAYAKLFNLAVPEWRIIAVIAETDGLTQQAVGRRTRMDKVTVSRATIALTARGLIVRTRNPGDGRSQLLSLSEEGRKLYRAVVPQARQLERAIFGDIPVDEIRRFCDTLDRITGSAEKLVD